MSRCHGDKVITVNESRDPQQAYDVKCPGCPDCDDELAAEIDQQTRDLNESFSAYVPVPVLASPEEIEQLQKELF